MVRPRRSRSDHLTHLASVPLFSRCHNAELRSLARRSADITAEAGQVHGAKDRASRPSCIGQHIRRSFMPVTRRGDPEGQ